ncbi:MAG: hypothetical protein KGM43_14705 [Planctomycetota bacterium]|nr:hypothetical protein [Planctomycetota bacterium]
MLGIAAPFEFEAHSDAERWGDRECQDWSETLSDDAVGSCDGQQAAEFEREIARERVPAGIAHARKEGRT